MITLIIKTYLSLFLIVLLSALTLFATGIYFILKPKRQSTHEHTPHQLSPPIQTSLTSVVDESFTVDITAIAGDDKLSTQLDLARAYLETNRKKLAKKMINHVIQHGSMTQQHEAKRLARLCE